MRVMPTELVYATLPDRVIHVLRTLTDAGHEVALVGGVVRDRLLGLAHRGEWDAATAARPEEVVALFEGATWENRFGTVTIGADPPVEITSYRAEGAYRDRRRPDEVRFGVSLSEDLARRDFTINAMAWLPIDLDAGRGTLVDPHGGQADLDARLLRAVGDPLERFAEDALRLIRAARFAGRLELAIDPGTEAAIRDLAPTVSTVSAERVRDELVRILARDPVPSRAIGLLERLGLLVVILPELAALRGIPQAKAVPGDALDHSLRAVDAAAPTDPPVLRLAALLHDVGKARTLHDGHFFGHERVSADMAAEVLRRLRVPRAQMERVVRCHSPPHVRVRLGMDRCRRAPVRAPSRERRPRPAVRAAEGRQRGLRRRARGRRQPGRARGPHRRAGQRRARPARRAPAGDRRE